MATAFNPSTCKAEAGGFLWIWGQAELQSEIVSWKKLKQTNGGRATTPLPSPFHAHLSLLPSQRYNREEWVSMQWEDGESRGDGVERRVLEESTHKKQGAVHLVPMKCAGLFNHAHLSHVGTLSSATPEDLNSQLKLHGLLFKLQPLFLPSSLINCCKFQW